MKATRVMTTLMLAGGLAAGPVFGQAGDFEGAYGLLLDEQVGQVERAEGLPEENPEGTDTRLTVGPEEDVQDSEEEEEQLASASQYEPLG